LKLIFFFTLVLVLYRT